ncbi:toll-like receptor 2 [Gadus macrocephalus]|uniref:toll-like receptor 2 n=1 Tax=Gadus macrocephalus TaxID=80720 RepID=UPI0028CBA31C|nr:toll-like receptor 2 [Gadus macrocephalus]
MAIKSVQVLLLLWTTVLLSWRTFCLAELIEDQGYASCVTSRRRVQNLSGQNLTNVPLDLNNETQYLDISYNPLVELQVAPFQRLSQLCFLKATSCGLRLINPGVFCHTPKLEFLNISNNLLENIPDLSLPLLKILDLGGNQYDSYQLPATFATLANLSVLYLGSVNALQVDLDDFDSLSDSSLHHLILGGGVEWQRYVRGSLAKMKSLQKITLKVPFCENLDLFENLLEDVNETQTTDLELVNVLPDLCNVTGDPFRTLRTMPLVKNLTIVNTWINSSFMVMFLKNVFLSNVRMITFANITYSEDTPDGFKFPTLNHTMVLSSVIFDSVKHYQYKYPIIEISVDMFSKMDYLKVSGSKINTVPYNLISSLPSLATLDLSNNVLTETGFWPSICSHTSVFPKLRHLSLSKNRFVDLSFIAQQTHQMKYLESLDLSFNSIVLDKPCFWPIHITSLSLSNNNLGHKVFSFLSQYLQQIDLSKTDITALTQEDLLQFPMLTHLFLSSNSIKVIPTDLSPTLVSLYIDQNYITSVSRESLAGLPSLRTLKAGDNPFVCSCDSYWFITTLNKSFLPDWPLDYTCSTPPSVADLPMSEYRTSRMSCEAWLQAAVALPVTMLIVLALCSAFYACDGVWYTKMLWVWIRVKRRGQKQANLLNNTTFRYHSFISYSHQDSAWVESKLVPSLEGAGLSLCIHERDFVPGQWIVDNIINCVEASYKTLFVLSNHFVQSEWCNYELFFAQHRAIDAQQDSLVFILLEPIPTNSLPKKFLKLRRLLMQQTYLEWPMDERKQQVFWVNLRSMLQVADHRILKDMALELAQSASLIPDDLVPLLK